MFHPYPPVVSVGVGHPTKESKKGLVGDPLFLGRRTTSSGQVITLQLLVFACLCIAITRSLVTSGQSRPSLLPYPRFGRLHSDQKTWSLIYPVVATRSATTRDGHSNLMSQPKKANDGLDSVQLLCNLIANPDFMCSFT